MHANHRGIKNSKNRNFLKMSSKVDQSTRFDALSSLVSFVFVSDVVQRTKMQKYHKLEKKFDRPKFLVPHFLGAATGGIYAVARSGLKHSKDLVLVNILYIEHFFVRRRFDQDNCN